MAESIGELVDRVRRHYDDGCFACGRDNPMGLHLDHFDLNDGVVGARFDPRPEYRGSGSMLHGGIAATALDEMLVWAGILIDQVMSVTGTFHIRYRKVVDVTDPVLVRAWIEERSGRRMKMAGHILVDDEVRIEASGLYLVTADVADLLVASH